MNLVVGLIIKFRILDVQMGFDQVGNQYRELILAFA
jgi:hypothetical protein